MARHAEGWKIVWRRGIAHVRFRHEGRRIELSTRTRDRSEARKTAARLYTEVVAGQRRVADFAARSPLKDALALWIESLGSLLAPRTVREYEIYGSSQWMPRWKTLGEVTEQAIGEWQRYRLRSATRDTLDKERAALRGFLVWCEEQKAIALVPKFPDLPRQSVGTRAKPKRKRRRLTDEEVRKLLAALPETSKKHRFKKNHQPFRVRDFFTVLWETSLRPSTVERLSEPEHYVKGADRLELFDDADKARDDRGVPLSKKARAALDRSCKGRGLIFGRHHYRDILTAVSEDVLGRRVHMDDFRHWRITRWLEDGKNIVGVQRLAGHKHLSTTARYVHPGFEAAAKVIGDD